MWKWKRTAPLRLFSLIALLLASIICTCAQTEGACWIKETGEEVCEKNSNNGGNAYYEDDDRIDPDGADNDGYDECADAYRDCAHWAERGECAANAAYMHAHCPVSCHTCPEREDRTEEEKILLKQIREYGEPQAVIGAESSVVFFVIKEALAYMKDLVDAKNPTHKMTPETIEKCNNRHEHCSFWAAIGECEANPSYMATTCAPSCKSCHLIDSATRCPIDPNAEPALAPGDLNKMFDRIVKEAEDGSKGYTVTVHSRPSAESMAGRVTDEENDFGQPPWIITFENFLSDEECDYLIQLGYHAEYRRSVEVFNGSLDGTVTQDRTSENAWCNASSGCRDDPIATSIYEKISEVVGIPPDNFEDLQILKYEISQFYHSHHDYIEEERDLQNGPRILTFFLYLSDNGLEGGGTKFTSRDPPLTIHPKTGRALLWPSVLNSNPRDIDPRMYHEALPVERGTKFAANAWVHLFNERKAKEMGCT
eukprot:CAMPEP_0178629214 /NCGR_PEP_ID=MMETSP0698-20121128/9831_1 /TAXON_ID=265572 /ORGANISM="Extubocellulus spinifer, Strain CCMP396" /LENGTH=480 /DNA_ID=CAMNT_0020268507 /DNA_START=52 /DNA_END=1494 /DNA_ORIENTATION=+